MVAWCWLTPTWPCSISLSAAVSRGHLEELWRRLRAAGSSLDCLLGFIQSREALGRVKMGGHSHLFVSPSLAPHWRWPPLDSPGLGLRSVSSWGSGMFGILVQVCCPQHASHTHLCGVCWWTRPWSGALGR